LVSAGSQRWQLFGLDEEFDAARDARSASDQSNALESEHHLVDRRWRDVEMALQVGLGGWAADHQGIGVNEGEVLALLVGEAMWAGSARGA